MLRTQVTIRTVHQGQERQSWFIFETDHDSLFDFNEALVEDGTVYGIRVETESIGNTGNRRVIRRAEFILAKDAMVTAISPPAFEVAG